MALGTGLSIGSGGTLQGTGINANPTNNSAFSTSGTGKIAPSLGNVSTGVSSPTSSSFGAGMSINQSGGLIAPYVNPSSAQIANLLMGGAAPTVRPTATGGATYNVPAPQTSSQSGQANAQAPVGDTVAKSLSDYTPNTFGTPNGGTLTLNPDGSQKSFAQAPTYSINTGNPAPSSALGQNTTYSDLSNQRSQYMDYLNGLAQAQQYSPQYLQALQASQNAQLGGAQITADSLTDPNFPGQTTNYAAGIAARAGALNTLQQQAATNALSLQQTMRQGNINAYTALAQGTAPNTLNQSVAPGSTVINGATGQPVYSGLGGLIGVNGINSVNSLSNQYPGAGILPTDSITTAQQKVANSPAYQAQFQSTYTQPGGGTGIYNKLQTGALTQNQDGTLTLVPAATAALGSANSTALTQQVQNYNNTQTAFNTANTTFGTMIKFMQGNGINQSDIPIINQITAKVKAGALDPGAIAAFNADIAELRTNYAQILSRGGSVAGTNEEATNLIPSTLKPSDMQAVLGQLSTNGNNALQALGGQISSITSNLGQGTGQYQQQSSSVANGSNPFSPSSFVIGTK